MRFETTGQFQAWARGRQVSIAAPMRTTRTTPPNVAPTIPAPPPALEDLFQTIQILATKYRWANQYTYNAEGEDAGLHVILAREVMLFAEVVVTPEALTPHQQAWLSAVRATGQAEAYAWSPADLPQIRARLGRKRGSI